jgi:uncharacterized membrane protein
MSQATKSETQVLAVERVLAKVLRIGSIIAGGLLAVGIGSMLLAGAPFAPRLITAGLVVLLLTPVLRVVVAAVVFCRERDWLFALFCLVVLCSLAAGVKFGLVG